MNSSFSSPTTSGEVKDSQVLTPSTRRDVGIFVPSVPSNPNPNRGAHNTYSDWPVIVKIAIALEGIVQRCGVFTGLPQDGEIDKVITLIESLSAPAKKALTHFVEELHRKLQDGRSQ